MRAVLLSLSCALLVAQPLIASADDKTDILQVVTDAYINGVHAKPDAQAMRGGFHPDFRMLVLSNGTMTAVTLNEWAERIEKAAANPSAQRPAIKSEIPQVDITGTAATVRVEIWRDDVHTFTDYLSLYKFADGWKIVGKTFYSHPRPGTR